MLRSWKLQVRIWPETKKWTRKRLNAKGLLAICMQTNKEVIFLWGEEKLVWRRHRRFCTGLLKLKGHSLSRGESNEMCNLVCQAGVYLLRTGVHRRRTFQIYNPHLCLSVVSMCKSWISISKIRDFLMDMEWIAFNLPRITLWYSKQHRLPDQKLKA